jgi:antitoxin PrlF
VVKATLTSKGQLTVPKEIREKLGLRVGDRLVFELLEEGSVRLDVERRKTLGELKGSLPARERYPGKEAEREAAREWAVREALGWGST